MVIEHISVKLCNYWGLCCTYRPAVIGPNVKVPFLVFADDLKLYFKIARRFEPVVVAVRTTGLIPILTNAVLFYKPAKQSIPILSIISLAQSLTTWILLRIWDLFVSIIGFWMKWQFLIRVQLLTSNFNSNTANSQVPKYKYYKFAFPS